MILYCFVFRSGRCTPRANPGQRASVELHSRWESLHLLRTQDSLQVVGWGGSRRRLFYSAIWSWSCGRRYVMFHIRVSRTRTGQQFCWWLHDLRVAVFTTLHLRVRSKLEVFHRRRSLHHPNGWTAKSDGTLVVSFLSRHLSSSYFWVSCIYKFARAGGLFSYSWWG